MLGLGERRRDHGRFLGLRGVGSRDRLVGAGAGVGLSSPSFLALEVVLKGVLSNPPEGLTDLFYGFGFYDPRPKKKRSGHSDKPNRLDS